MNKEKLSGLSGCSNTNVAARPWRAIGLSLFFSLVTCCLLLVTVLHADDAEIKLNSNDGSTNFVIQDNTGIAVSSITSVGNAYFKGNVGIGRNNPITHLDIAGDVRMKSDDSGSYWRNLLISGSSSSKLTLEPWNYSIAAALQVEGPLDLAFVGTTSGHPFNIRTNNLDRITIGSTGNVGIGTINPSEKLSILGSASITNSAGTALSVIQDAPAPGISITQNGQNNGLYIESNLQRTVGYFLLSAVDNNTSNTAATIRTANFGNGEALWAYKGGTGGGDVVRISNNGTGEAISIDQNAKIGADSGPLTFRTLNNDRVIISTTGNVGIGTTTPTAKLDVNGQIKSVGRRAAVITVSAPYTVSANDEIIIITNTSGTTITLPELNAGNGRIITIKSNQHMSSVVTAGSGTTIEGSSSYNIPADETANFILVDTTWFRY